MDVTALIIMLLVGLVAGWLASVTMGGVGYGLLGDIVIGVLGAFIGSWLFRALGVGVPISGIAGTIFVAFVGAVVLMILLRVLRASGKSRSS